MNAILDREALAGAGLDLNENAGAGFFDAHPDEQLELALVGAGMSATFDAREFAVAEILAMDFRPPVSHWGINE